MQPFEALRVARERGLDLVEISPTADPPVCKITDYGKFLYQQSKKAHEQRKSSRGSQLKEVKFRPATAEHDFQVRKSQILRFLGEGHKVRAMIFHRGREMAHQEVGRAKMTRLLAEIGEQGQIETMPRMEGNVLVALLAPKKGGTPGCKTGRTIATERVVVLGNSPDSIRVCLFLNKFQKWPGSFGPYGEDSKQCHAIGRNPS